MPTPAKLVWYRDRKGGHRWRVTSRNGKRIAASSEGFATQAMARKNLGIVGRAIELHLAWWRAAKS